MANSRHVAEALSKRSDCPHKHAVLFGGGRPAKAAVYPDGVRQALCGDLKEHLEQVKVELAVWNVTQLMLNAVENLKHYDEEPEDWSQYIDVCPENF